MPHQINMRTANGMPAPYPIEGPHCREKYIDTAGASTIRPTNIHVSQLLPWLARK